MDILWLTFLGHPVNQHFTYRLTYLRTYYNYESITEPAAVT